MQFLCRWLNVSSSGFYAWEKREASARARKDRELLETITKVYWESGGRYGSPRVFKKLKQRGFCIGRKRVERLMKVAGLQGRVVQVTRRAVGLREYLKQGNNLLMHMDKPTGIDQVWVADVTYLKINGNWQYLATVMDLFSRRIIGWSLSDTRKATLTRAALRSAYRKRRHPQGVLLHTDRGSEYRGEKFQSLIRAYGIKHSLSRPGHCTDNAFMESFYHSLKAELIRGTTFKSVRSLRKSLSSYINSFYNRVRLHSGIGYMSPMEYELRYA